MKRVMIFFVVVAAAITFANGQGVAAPEPGPTPGNLPVPTPAPEPGSIPGDLPLPTPAPEPGTVPGNLPFGFVAQEPGEIPGNLPLPTFEFTASLSGTNEVPPNNSTATGTATFTLEGNLFRYQIFTPLPFAPTGAQIHGPAMPGQNINALVTLDGPMFVAPVPGGGDGGYAFTGNRTLSSEESSQLLAGLWYVNISSAAFPDGELRGQILPVPPDADHDSVPDNRDECPDTLGGAVVDANGCSIQQLTPCDASWRNHGAYVRRVIRAAVKFQRDGLITRTDRRTIVRAASRSDCGRHCRTM